MFSEPEVINRSTDRVLELAPIEGKTPTSAQGQTDKRLFTGEQKLHIKMDPETTLWYFKWDSGALPQALQGRFTGFKPAIKYAEDYFLKRNIQVTRVLY